MNLLLVTETYPPEINGVARTLHQMARGLADLGHEVCLVRPAQRRPGPVDHARGIETHEVGGLPLPGYPDLQFGLPAGGLLRGLLAKRQIDAAYIATEGPLGRSALRACQRNGVPALTGMHTNFHQYSAHYGAGLLGPALLAYLRRFHNRSAGTLVPTERMRIELERIGFRNLHVWPRGVHARLFTPRRRDARLRAEWSLDDDGLAVLYVGRLAPEKNIDTAFLAFDAIRDARPDARFVLVGNGPAEPRLRAAHPHAIFVGPKQGEELARHYASGDLFLFPSVTETFGNVTLEAMASGLAVVSYDLAAAHELIEHGTSGLLAAPGAQRAFVDEARRCAADGRLQRTLKRHARATALQQDWPKILRRLEHMLLAFGTGPVGDGFQGTAESTERP